MKRALGCVSSMLAMMALACGGSNSEDTKTSGSPGAGGEAATGGMTAAGGNPGSGGKASTGGATGSGDVLVTGGKPATGGAPGSGGNLVTGGKPGTGGTLGSGGVAGNGGFTGDTYLPWYGGPSYHKAWSRGLPSDPSFFLLSVWMQTPSNAARYQAVGVKVFTGLWDGPTNAQLSTLSGANTPTICEQAVDWQAHLTDTTIRGWLQPDEPDNAQANGSGGYDPCIDPKVIIAGYNTMKTNDPSRPVYLGLGRGVADTQWVGRGTCTGRTDMYPEYAKGADILGFDIYPVNEGAPLEMVASGLDNLLGWSNHAKPVIGIIEASNFNDTQRPTPAQIRSEVWMDLVHGAAGIEYFCHRFEPTFSETDCLDDAPTAAALKSVNSQITSLAPVLNSPSVGNGVTIASSVATIPVDTMLKRYGGATYLFAAEMRGGSTTATFTLRDFPSTASAEVLGESRTIAVNGGVFSDAFASYGVHLYRITY